MYAENIDQPNKIAAVTTVTLIIHLESSIIVLDKNKNDLIQNIVELHNMTHTHQLIDILIFKAHRYGILGDF